MRQYQHVERSLEAIQKEKPDLYKKYPGIVKTIVGQVHSWMDSFANTEPTMKEHRKHFHHWGGPAELERNFTAIYGKTLGRLARREAFRHIVDDCGYIPEEKEYYQKPKKT